SEVWDDGLPVAGVAADQGVVHRPLRPDVADGPRLVDVEVGRGVVDAEPERSPVLRTRLGTDRRRGLLGTGAPGSAWQVAGDRCGGPGHADRAEEAAAIHAAIQAGVHAPPPPFPPSPPLLT